jgi:hypothetical protein
MAAETAKEYKSFAQTSLDMGQLAYAEARE